MVDRPHDAHLPVAPVTDRMQRVRVGVTGLAAVLLVVLLATAIATGVRHSAGTDGNNVLAAPTVVATSAAPSNGLDATAEPLAQLGAAPGGKSDDSNGRTAKH